MFCYEALNVLTFKIALKNIYSSCSMQPVSAPFYYTLIKGSDAGKILNIKF